MNIYPLLQGSRWEILELIASGKRSTTEIAKAMGTSAAYVSQQLKQLELAGVIQKERSNKRKSHYRYMIEGSMALLTKLGPGVAQKNIYRGSNQQQRILQLLAYKHAATYIVMLLTKGELLGKFSAYGILDRETPQIFVLTDHVEEVRREHSKVEITTNEGTQQVAVWAHSPDEVRRGLRNNEEYFVRLLQEMDIMKDNKEIHKLKEEALQK